MDPRVASLVRGATWPALIAAAVLLVFSPALRADRTLSRRDTASMIEPARPLVAEALRAGRLPLWNPYEATGHPLLGDGLHSVLHPVSVAGAWLAPGSMDFLLLGYLLWAALGAYALGRALGASAIASAAAGVAYSTCGFVASMTGIATFLAGAGALAWMLAAARWTGAGAALGPAACAVATAVAFLSGDTQMAIVGGALGVALSVAAGGWRQLPRVVAGMGAGTLLAGVQLAASWGTLRDSTRALPLGQADRVSWALHPLRLLEWIVPGLTTGGAGALVPYDVLGTPQLPGGFSESVYLGVVLLSLAAAGLARDPGGAGEIEAAPRRTRAVLAASAVVLLWVAFGHRLGARQLLDAIPVWSRFRYAEKMMAPLSLVLSVAAALGVDRLVRERLPPAVRTAAAAAGALSAALLAAALLTPAPVRALLAVLADRGADFFLQRLVHGLPHAALGSAALLALDRLARGARGPLSAALLAASTAAGVGYAVAQGDAAAHAVQPAVRLAPEAVGPVRLAHPVSRQVTALGGFAPLDANLAFRRLILAPPLNVAARVDAIGSYGALASLRMDELMGAVGERWADAERRLGVTHVVVLPPATERDARAIAAAVRGGALALDRPSAGFQVWAVPHRPWASFAEAVVPVTGGAAARVAELIARGDERTVVVAADRPLATAPGVVSSALRAPEALRIEAEASGDGLLVVGDAFWPGWRAWLDGREVPVLAADHVLRAVPFPAGRHVLEMRYEPAELRIGWMLSALGAVLAVGLAVAGLRAAPGRPERGTG